MLTSYDSFVFFEHVPKTADEFKVLVKEIEAAHYVANASADKDEINRANNRICRCEKLMDESIFEFDDLGNVVLKNEKAILDEIKSLKQTINDSLDSNLNKFEIPLIRHSIQTEANRTFPAPNDDDKIIRWDSSKDNGKIRKVSYLKTRNVLELMSYPEYSLQYALSKHRNRSATEYHSVSNPIITKLGFTN